MSLCTLYSVSHHCLDEILTFLKYDVLHADNTCPKSSYEMKRLMLKLGLSDETIHCCQCGKTLYWKENLNLDHCPKCQNSRYIPGSSSIPTRVLRYFSVIKRLRRMFRCPELAKHLRWHRTNHSADRKMRSVVDSEQWGFIENDFPVFSRENRNIRMGLALDGVNPHSHQSSKHSIWPVMLVLYNLPPYLVTKRFFICLSMIIPGPNSPSEDTIDVYYNRFCMSSRSCGWAYLRLTCPNQLDRKETSTCEECLYGLYTMAYTLISGQSGKGYAGCPICGEGTFAEHSRHAHKTFF